MKLNDKVTVQGVTGTVVRTPLVVAGTVYLYIKSDTDGRTYYVTQTV